MDGSAKRSAAELYESCAFDQLLGESLRPGGLELTARVADIAGVAQNSTVLDIACGKGTTVVFLAGEYGCKVVGIDLSDKMIDLCWLKIRGSDQVAVLRGDAEDLPFRAGSFDVVISECSFSLLPDKERAARGIERVLKRGGKLVMTDIILRGEVSQELRGQITFACCLAGAWRAKEYIGLLERVGFRSSYLEDHSTELTQVAYQIGMAFGSIDNFVGWLPQGPCRRKGEGTARTSTESYQEFVRAARPGYALLAVTKP
ncbi:MAG TPA: class I SAM-dependent methyltransferase [Dehalococcoidia bacterium]|nr:class I SAM-dependent methyltransferase [Dehalococcoidia bacterium]